MRDDCLNPAINRRAKHFRLKRAISERFHLEGDYQIADALSDCNEIKRAVSCLVCHSAFYILDRCRKRVCPLCSFKESLRRGKFIERVCHKMAYPKCLTLTMPRWTDTPQDGIKHLRTAWNLLRKSPVFSAVKGGVCQIELKRKPNGWHIHLHAIIDAPFLPHQHLYSTWRKILGIEHASIWINAATTPAQRHYAAKYTAKAADWDGDLATVVAWHRAVKGQRLFSAFGDWYNKDESDLPADQVPAAPEYLCSICGENQQLVSYERLHYVLEGWHLEEALQRVYAQGPPTISAW